jgi:hypothetical protein
MNQAGISIPIILSTGRLSVTLSAKIDTGAHFCIFERGYGEALGIDIDSGEQIRIGTATGSFIALGHELTLTTLDYEFNSVVYFASEYSFSRNVLGRHGWLDKVRIGLVDYESKLYLSQYDES